MPSYNVRAINIGKFLLGEADKVLTIFTAEKGIVKAVAKGARKPGTKMSGRADILCANNLLLSTGRTFEIITQAESIDVFPEFRADLTRLSYGLYYAELAQHFGQGLAEESEVFYQFLLSSLRLQARSKCDPAWLCLEFEMGLLDLLGYKPELTYCVVCRGVLGDYNIATFHRDLGGVLCQRCSRQERVMAIREHGQSGSSGLEPGEWNGRARESSWREGAHITPLVWKNLVLAAHRRISEAKPDMATTMGKMPIEQTVQAARRLVQGYIEQRMGRRLKALDILEQITLPGKSGHS